jgi:hypothetical protein
MIPQPRLSDGAFDFLFMRRQIQLLFGFVVGMLAAIPGMAQESEEPTLRLGAVLARGVRSSATESWGSYEVVLTNLTKIDRKARVLIRYVDKPDELFGRVIWVPGQAELTTWILVGPASRKEEFKPTFVEVFLYDRTDGTDRLILPQGDKVVRERPVVHRIREPFTTILIDEEPEYQVPYGKLPEPDSRNDEAIRLARTFRLARKQSEFVQILDAHTLPPNPEAFDGIDLFVLASNRLAHDPAGMKALRQWLERGSGILWIMLDLIDVETLTPLLGDALDFQVVDRVPMTQFRVVPRSAGQQAAQATPLQEYDQAVDFVRVLSPSSEQARYTIDGWPTWFSRRVGRGKVVFTTLGPRGWYRPRRTNEPPAPFENFRSTPVPLAAFEDLALELQGNNNPVTTKPSRSAQVQDALPSDTLAPMLTEDIGYSVVSRTTVLLVVAAFLGATLLVGVFLRQTNRPELLGWLGPLAALVAGGVFLLIGESARRAVPPTVAIVQVADAVAGENETAVHGLIGVYRPDSGPAEMGTRRGGFFDADMSGLEVQIHRLVLTDMDAWHWENVSLPAGVRFAPFRATLPIREPLEARARFGPDGLEGKLTAARLSDVSDSLVITASGRNLAVQMQADGAFQVRSSDILPEEQFLRLAVLNDRQQRHQDVYRQLLLPNRPEYLRGRNVLLAWSKPLDMDFTFLSDARTTGSALLIVPLRFERPSRNARVTIPGPLVPYQRMLDQVATRPTFSWQEPIDMQLRFQLPHEVLPLKVESARLSARITAPSRPVIISGRQDDKLVELHRVVSPLDPIHLEIKDEHLLRLDRDGGLRLNLSIGNEVNRERKTALDTSEKWKIEYLELEVTGRAEE